MHNPHAIFDRTLLRARKERAAAHLTAHDFLLREAAARLADRLDDMTRVFPASLELGAHGPILTEAIRERGGIETFFHTALSGALLPGYSTLCAVCDEEALPFAENRFDAVFSLMSLHWVNDLPGTLAQIGRMLKPDGLFLAMLPGGQTLHELREAFDTATLECEGGVSPRVSPFLDVRDAGSLLQRAGFALPVVDSDRLTISYAHVDALLDDLRRTGEANVLHARNRAPLRRKTLEHMRRIYAQRFSEEGGRVRATCELVTLTAWKPDTSQPRPLKRGSGEINLGDALN